MKKDKKEDKDKVKQSPAKVFSNGWKMFRLVAKYLPSYPFFMVLDGVLWGLLNAAVAIFTIRLFNELDKSDVSFASLALVIGIMAVFYVIAYFFDAWYWDYYNTTLFQKLQYRMQKDLYEKARSMDLACYDDPAFYNDYVFAMDQARNKAWELTEGIGKIINRLVASTAILSYMATMNGWIALMIFAFAVLSFFLGVAIDKLYYKGNLAEQPMHRKNSYVNRQFHLADGAKEMRTGRISENLVAMYEENVDELVKTRVKFRKKILPFDVFWSLIDSVLPIAIGAVSFLFLIRGEVALGGFAGMVTSLWQVRWLIYNLMERLKKFPEQSLYFEKYLTFLNKEPAIRSGDKEPGEFESLVFEDVSFAYPFGEEKEVLSHINFRVEKGERVALVGYNGAGKTTLTKLIMRLYDPSSGRILYNGEDIRTLKLEAYREKIGTVFQDFKIFAASLAENVLHGPYDGEEATAERVKEALAQATFGEELAKLPHGVDTELTKEFCEDGVNLSGGESQKVAIARIFAKPYELIIMDEPSSALDPMAEYQLNHTILDGASQDGRTVIFISHRLSTTRMADRIYLFANGCLAEQGSHEELMALGGKYDEMFTLQAEKYRDKEADEA